MEQLPKELKLKVEEWLLWDKNEDTIKEIKKLVVEEKIDFLNNVMMSRLMFGTAGLRGRMGAGYAQMNDLVIIQTSQGLVKYLLSVCPEATTRGIVLGYDSRHNSHRFAQLAASCFLTAGVKVYLHGKICPTPFVPFAVKELNAAAGVMVTASHNPKEDNGYKVYWTNSAQIIPPHDSGIQSCIEQNFEPWDGVWDIEKALTNPNLSNKLDEMSVLYYQRLSSAMLDKKVNASTPLQFTVTAMHGVGHAYVEEAFKACGFKPFVPVVEQMVPDPEFPTVRFPNPEEGKSALDLSFATADKAGSKIILANDPDADRLALAVKLDNGWKVFTGNEEGALFAWWAWQRCKIRNTNVKAEDCYMIASTVSSKIPSAIAIKEGFNFEETLTGFKWMCNRACELMDSGKTVLFAFEEAIGYMMGTEVLDKDGVSGAVFMAELAAYLNDKGITLYEQLQNIYKEYGFHVSNNSYYLCYDQSVISKMFHRMRNYEGPESYPKSIGKYSVKSVRDLTTGFDSSQPDGKAFLPVSAASEMITFSFSNGCVMTIRTSGTEPKIKYYSEMCATPQQTDWNALEAELAELVDGVVQELLQPQVNKLQPKPE